MKDVEIPSWLQDLPLAPEFHPTDTEFADPVAYISKIEKQASAFGICKVIPPLPKPSRKYVISNLNRSLSKSPELFSDCPADLSNSSKLENGDLSKTEVVQAVFTTRQQELGQSVKRTRGSGMTQPSAIHKQVWQSGENYTIDQFESKSKAFALSVLGTMKEVSPLAVETLFWKADSEKPIYLEYANDVPGSGFGEAQGLFRYFHRKRRKINFNRNISVHVSPKNTEINSKANSNPSFDPSKPYSSPLGLLSDKMCLDVDNDMQGSAGWKLSNSPWNLQIISRSAGSLTRFMPDDIPGVTSPMVYIGMLFSWFAWHIEDHELHSLNFLHTGYPKTWYAVPAKYASAFEDVICKQVYGGNLDLLDFLSLLGEKTTLVSPEVIVSAGIPCCRLIQNPGEFVVTFPRAYHVGFSHGFNCGEAANFGTPQWLKVAKEAAVRRAAMNYLPMLSHQQLLYLLTISFASRVPRSLLPGARNSRLRDRQKEEREHLVKKAFIKDMLNENKFASVLLEKQTIYCAALWNPDSLPCSSKYSNSVALTPTQDILCVPSENEEKKSNLFDEMRSYMETVNDLYVDHTDLYTDFQVDAATLACVACGILGFPFMCILQPSDREAMDRLSVGCLSVQECDGDIKTLNSSVSVSDHRDTKNSKDKCCGSGRDLDLIKDGEINGINLPDHALICSITKLNKGWNGCNGALRPRIFCLEHAIQIEELLQSKGGANLLVICHSDYQKIKLHSEGIAEEIGSCFDYNDIPLEKASEENLNLINLAIDNEEHDQEVEDWTSKLGINLQYCINVKKKTSSKVLNHALRLGGLFSEPANTVSETTNLNWQSRKSRSKHIAIHGCNPCESIELQNLPRIEKIIQYSRRIKCKQHHPKSEEKNGFRSFEMLQGIEKTESCDGYGDDEATKKKKALENCEGCLGKGSKGKKLEKMGMNGYIRSPCEGLRPRLGSSKTLKKF